MYEAIKIEQLKKFVEHLLGEDGEEASKLIKRIGYQIEFLESELDSDESESTTSEYGGRKARQD